MCTRQMFFGCIYSLVMLLDGIDGALESPKPFEHHTDCARYLVKEMIHLFADEKISNEIQQVVNKMKIQQKENRVAFSANLASEATYSNKQILKFTKVITNIGNGLNTTDGVFYCPVPGVYSFFLNIQSNTDHAYAQIHKNDKVVMYVFTDESGKGKWKSGSNEVILQLKRGDTVSIKSHLSVRYHPMASHFNGHILWIQ
nr:complement C1q domain-containing protein [Anadara sativa]